ncbi:MAG TPA: hypothetical protein PLB92_00235 [Rhodoglobus sp.]|nr:hypothetical protein [Rhodoglobus sp.]
MNSNTEVLPELDEELDFEISCEAGNPSGGPCENPAKWMAQTPCKHSPFMCESHHALAVVLAFTHQKAYCEISQCGAHFCLCEVTWRHL